MFGKHPNKKVITAYIDGELPEAKAAAVGRHLATCATCGAMARAQARAVELLRSSCPAASPIEWSEPEPEPEPELDVLTGGSDRHTRHTRHTRLNGMILALSICGLFLFLYGMQSLLVNLAGKTGSRTAAEVLFLAEEHENLVDYFNIISIGSSDDSMPDDWAGR
ncbi:MAG TPA: zf-HC2 domain-containing protein [Firmicutes bacterium]|nr:zf-HC2 domain-containing protein [Bacillota bacterium]